MPTYKIRPFRGADSDIRTLETSECPACRIAFLEGRHTHLDGYTSPLQEGDILFIEILEPHQELRRVEALGLSTYACSPVTLADALNEIQENN